MYFIYQNASEFNKQARQAAVFRQQLEAIRERVRFFGDPDGKVKRNYHYRDVNCLISLPNGRVALYRLYWGDDVNDVSFSKDYATHDLCPWFNECDKSCAVSLETVQKERCDFTPLIKEMQRLEII